MGNILEKCFGEEEDDFFVGEPDTSTFKEVSSVKAGQGTGGFGMTGELPPELKDLVAAAKGISVDDVGPEVIGSPPAEFGQSYQDVNGSVPTGPSIDNDGLAQQVRGSEY